MFTVTSYGYSPGGGDGSIDATHWAQIQEELGEAYGVSGAADWKVTTVSGVDRTVRVAAGSGFGRGVYDVVAGDTAPTVQLDVVSSGSRFDLVVARRTWGVTPATTFTKVPGTGSQSIPSGRLTGPGIVDDQPLALVQVTAGSSNAVVVKDLRTWASKVITAADLMALVDAKYGDEAVVGDTRYRYVLDASGSLRWTPVPAPLGQSWQAERAATDAFGAGVFASMVSLSLPGDAPAGRYLVTADLAVSGTPTQGNLRVTVGSTIVSGDSRTDVTAAVLDKHFAKVVSIVPSGAAIAVSVGFRVVSGTSTVHGGGTRITAIYLGP